MPSTVKTVLKAWKNAIANWTYKRRPGSPPLSKAAKDLILKLKKENFLWGARRIISIVPYSPDMNAYAERFVRSMRRDCLDYFVIFTQGQLRRIVKGYIDYYNNYRPHQGLRGIPNAPPEPALKTGAIRKKPLLFGLHNHYYREAA